ncbi:MAG TPA: translation initiation factor [Dissulfurispiraceae bacterium]|nr:translation initiation factor [Dissulfurispiraceae bacterium]
MGDTIREVAEPAPPRVVVRLERKGRGGKSVTVIDGLHVALGQRQALLKRLKSALGTGGTVRESTIEIQGDHRDALVEMLTRLGYRSKRSG